MELEVYWLEFAENKLHDIYDYYSLKANKRVAQKLVKGILDTTIGVEKQPKIGQIEISLQHRKEEFRYLIFKNYKIIYWINDEFQRIEIVNVFATKQDPKKINEME
ncbi:type II toxin-antitoxin system RelE/ParE family toxin [uncultured Kordia sp.]|uniref:type II toxin-antitoxin system RelE/ParE family toxin n=1 Tax=uncultured Kordia sp. TaxID=507699 RepID=UPI00260BCF4E|nr:type II toxin-antitoxin system RelE/ParE family toxin [uncultured Kordia sp.]